MQNNEKITSELSEEDGPSEKFAYTVDISDPQALHDFLNVKPKLTEEMKKFNEAMLMFHKMAPIMSEEEANENYEALHNYNEAKKNGEILEDDFPF